MSLNFSFSNIVLVAIILITLFCLIRIITYGVSRLEKFSFNKTSIYLIRDALQAVIYVVAIIYVFAAFGINLGGILVSLGIGGIALGYAAKDIISSIMGGVLLISDRHVQIGDVIEVDGYKGKITKISFRNTSIVDEDGFIITIPNSTLTNTPYVKFKPNEMEKIVINVTIPYEVDIKTFEERLIEKMKHNEEIADMPEPHFRTKGIVDYGTFVEVRCFLKEFKEKEEIKLIIIKQANKIIHDELKKL